jgi:hypothetical protein
MWKLYKMHRVGKIVERWKESAIVGFCIPVHAKMREGVASTYY